MIGGVIRVTKVDQNVKKGPPSHQNMKCSFLDYVQLLMISQVIRAMKVYQNAKKGPLSHQKMKCSSLDYVQLPMIGQVIRATEVNRNVVSVRVFCCFSLDLLLFQSGSSVVQSRSSVIIIIVVLVTLILSGGAVAMFHQVQSLHLGLTWLVVLCFYFLSGLIDSTFLRMCAVPRMADLCRWYRLCFPGIFWR